MCNCSKHHKKCCKVNLNYQEIYDDLWPDRTSAIYHQFDWQEVVADAAVKVLEGQKDFVIPKNIHIPGTDPNPCSNVYGYHRDGKLDLDGGKAKSYTKDFKDFKLRCHTAFEAKYPDENGVPTLQQLTFLTPEVRKEYYERMISYFTNRGFGIQGADTFSKFKNQYIWQYSAGQSQDPVTGFGYTSNAYVALRPIWKHKCDYNDKRIPDYIDLHATANTTPLNHFVLDTYECDRDKRKNGYGYPLRIPITTDYCGTFKKLKNKKPIAFFDCEKQILTVHVPLSENGHFLTKRVVNTGNPDLNVDYKEYLMAFDGSFSLLHRNEDNILVPSNFNDAELFAQVSENMYVRSQVINAGQLVVPDFEYTNPIRAPILAPDTNAIYYTGAVISIMNGGSDAYDNFAFPTPFVNSYGLQLDPVDIPEENVNGSKYAAGDCPNTTVVEKYSIVSTISSFDNSDWNLLFLSLPLSVLTGQSSYPENVSTTVLPRSVDAVDSYQVVDNHEFTHQVQNTTGVIQFLPAEGMAVGIELDPYASSNMFGPFRAAAISQRHVRLTRGAFSIMTPDTFGVNTYGLGLFWTYLRDQYDYNNQIMRRTMDILTNKTLGPLMRENDFPDGFANLPINKVGGSAAMNIALKELFCKNIKDLWNDFSISLVLMRNNTSIPKQWRNYWPFWIYNTQYSGYNQLVDSANVFGAGQFINWWERLDSNDVIPANYRTPYTGETFIRTLPSSFSSDATSLQSFSFNVPHETNNISVNIAQGEWRITLLQYTSDGTMEGSFIVDGPHTLKDGQSINFNVAAHNPAFTSNGNIRLVCANVTFDGKGNTLAEYFTEEAPNGSIAITSA